MIGGPSRRRHNDKAESYKRNASYYSNRPGRK